MYFPRNKEAAAEKNRQPGTFNTETVRTNANETQCIKWNKKQKDTRECPHSMSTDWTNCFRPNSIPVDFSFDSFFFCLCFSFLHIVFHSLSLLRENQIILSQLINIFPKRSTETKESRLGIRNRKLASWLIYFASRPHGCRCRLEAKALSKQWHTVGVFYICICRGTGADFECYTCGGDWFVCQPHAHRQSIFFERNNLNQQFHAIVPITLAYFSATVNGWRCVTVAYSQVNGAAQWLVQTPFRYSQARLPIIY